MKIIIVLLSVYFCSSLAFARNPLAPSKIERSKANGNTYTYSTNAPVSFPPIKNHETIMIKVPSSWDVVWEQSQGVAGIVELVPQGQKLQNWLDLFTVIWNKRTGKAVTSPSEILQLKFKYFQDSCAKAHASGLRKQKEAGYQVAYQTLVCEKNKSVGIGEKDLYKAVLTDDYFFLIFRSWKLDSRQSLGELSAAEVEKWQKILEAIYICSGSDCGSQLKPSLFKSDHLYIGY